MKYPKITRRTFLRIGLYSLPACSLADSFFIEPEWVVVKKITVGKNPTHRIVHFTDLHYKGCQSYLTTVIDKINVLSPDFVCFAGDIVEDTVYLNEALDFMKQICCPVFGVPGNHDYWSGASFPAIAKSLEATGGRWLIDQATTTSDGTVSVIGATGKNTVLPQSPKTSKRLLLTHYPAFVDELKGQSFDLLLAGHSHGGQVRIPFFGALILPGGVGKYDKGLFQTAPGPLYVNPGIGYWYLPVRFCCRPELTLIQF